MSEDRLHIGPGTPTSAVVCPALLVLLVVALAAPAAACMNTVLAGREATQRLAEAEAALERGEHARVRTLLPRLVITFDDGGHRQRAVVLRAVSFMRADASLLAVQALLRDRLTEAPDDPRLVAWLAETMTRSADRERWAARALKETKNVLAAPRSAADRAQVRAEALAMLTPLEQRDLMPDGWAWVTLATLHAQRDDAAARDRALARCRQVSPKAELCHPL